MKKFLVLLLLTSIECFAGWFSSASSDTWIHYQNWQENIQSRINTIQSNINEVKQLQADAERWKYIFQNLDSENLKTQIEDFDDFVNAYKKYTGTIDDMYNSTNDLENQFYNVFLTEDQLKKMNMNEINKKNEKVKKMSEDTLKNSNQLIYYLTNDKTSKDANYIVTQQKIQKQLSDGSVDPNKLLGYIIQNITQTNQLLMEIKAINVSMLQQVTTLKQKEIADQKKIAEENRRKIESSKNNIEKWQKTK